MNDNRFTSAPAAEAPVAETPMPRFPSIKSRIFSRTSYVVQSVLLTASIIMNAVQSDQLHKDARTMEENAAIIAADGKRLKAAEGDGLLRREIPALDMLVPPLNSLEWPDDFDQHTGAVLSEKERIANRERRIEKFLNLWLNDGMKNAEKRERPPIIGGEIPVRKFVP